MNEQNVILEEDGFEEEIDVLEESSVTLAMWGDITGNIENQTDLQNALDAKQDSLSQAQLDATNSGITSAKVAKYDGYEATINAKANQSALNAEATTRAQADTALGRRIDDEATARQQADNGLQTQIDAITSKSDVVDVVANYAALQAYDTSSLGNNDVIKVLDDETHEDALTYYRWSTTTQTWSYIGQEAPYYSKGQMDVMLQGKQDKLTAGANIQIENGTISATDTTYTAGNGLNLNGTEFSADTDILATKEDLEDYYTKPETDSLLAPKLEAEVVTELPMTGEDGKLYLTPKAHTTQTATGNPITATVAEEAGAIESFQLDGDTYQQSYEGKNLYDYVNAGYPVIRSGIEATLNADGSITVTGLPTSSYVRIVEHDMIDELEDGSTYTLSSDNYSADLYIDVAATRVGGGTAYPANTRNGSASFTVDKSSFSQYRISILTYTTESWGSDSKTITRKFQLEKSASATSFEPYVGGVPSPNPDYPQAIQTVAGLQTISINGTDYPIDLGDIELCGLGDDGNGNPLYKDYIYPDGSEWKIHKATTSITLDGSEAWGVTGVPKVYGLAKTAPKLAGLLLPTYNTAKGVINSTHFYAISNSTNIKPGGLYIGAENVNLDYNDSNTDLEGFETWLSSNRPTLLTPLATPTDTTITDQALIAQLEAVANASLASGANTITNTATGSNLAGDMEIGYYGHNPRNRYDKFIWLDINNEYEQIGS